ncbi:hypothetical protein QOT17_002447 [Balamuthia mandrillaris]
MEVGADGQQMKPEGRRLLRELERHNKRLHWYRAKSIHAGMLLANAHQYEECAKKLQETAILCLKIKQLATLIHQFPTLYLAAQQTPHSEELLEMFSVTAFEEATNDMDNEAIEEEVMVQMTKEPWDRLPVAYSSFSLKRLAAMAILGQASSLSSDALLLPGDIQDFLLAVRQYLDAHSNHRPCRMLPLHLHNIT